MNGIHPPKCPNPHACNTLANSHTSHRFSASISTAGSPWPPQRTGSNWAAKTLRSSTDLPLLASQGPNVTLFVITYDTQSMNGSIESIQKSHSQIRVIKQFTIHHQFTTIFLEELGFQLITYSTYNYKLRLSTILGMGTITSHKPCRASPCSTTAWPGLRRPGRCWSKQGSLELRLLRSSWKRS